MAHWAETDDEEHLSRLESKTAEVRKMLLGTLLLAKDLWKAELVEDQRGLEILDGIEAAEDSFPDRSEPDQMKRLEQALETIDRRAGSIFELLSYISMVRGHH